MDEEKKRCELATKAARPLWCFLNKLIRTIRLMLTMVKFLIYLFNVLLLLRWRQSHNYWYCLRKLATSGGYVIRHPFVFSLTIGVVNLSCLSVLKKINQRSAVCSGGNRCAREEVIKRQYLLKHNDVGAVCDQRFQQHPNLFAFKYLLVRNVLRLCTAITFSYNY